MTKYGIFMAQHHHPIEGFAYPHAKKKFDGILFMMNLKREMGKI